VRHATPGDVPNLPTPCYTRIARKTGGLRCCGRWSAIGAAKTWLGVKELPQLARDLIGSQRIDVAKTQAKIGWRDEVGDGHHQAIQVG
jgi:hypothetical protein